MCGGKQVGMTPIVAASALSITLLVQVTFAQTSRVLPDSEIRKILVDRIDKYQQSVGIVVGVIEPEGRRLIAYGRLDQGDQRPLNGDTVFEIGSNTKVFTSLLLAEMVQRGEVALTDPLGKYLPAEIKVPERGGRKITLLDLSTHTSGLPRDPPNLNPKDPTNPFAEYSVEQLYEFLSTYQLTRDIGSLYEYSNVGVALLGHALTRRAGMDYESLVQARITSPLAMGSTRISLTSEMKTRIAVGHGYYKMSPVPNMDMAVYAPAGALRSTANDLLTFLGANLGYTATPLANAIAAMLKVRRPIPHSPAETALAWGVVTLSGVEVISHNGGTIGTVSFIGFDPKARVGVVVLSNRGAGVGVSDIGIHLLNPKLPLLSGNALKPPKERQEITVDPKLLDGFVGRYRFSRDDRLTVTREGGHLYVQRTGELKTEVYPESARDYFAKLYDEQVTFKTDGQGRATELIHYEDGSTRRAKRID